MELIRLDYEKCIKCGACFRVCPGKVFVLEDKKPLVKYPEVCIECTHCVAVCPVEAVQMSNYPLEKFESVKDPSISYEMFSHLINGRRSIRNFQDRPVEKNLLEKLMEAQKLSPTGENAQELQYTIIFEAEVLDLIREKMYKIFRLAWKAVKFPGITFLMRLFVGKDELQRLVASLQRMMERHAEGEDPFLRGCKTLVIIHTRAKTAMKDLDAGVAGHQLNLAAETLGLGACWIGFHTALSKYFSSIKKSSQIPKKHQILGTIALGYPKEKYHKYCVRKPLKINYIEEK